MSEKKEYKWQVRPGGTIPVDAVGIKTATAQTGSLSMKNSLAIDKGIQQTPTIDGSAMGIAHAINVPDSSFSSTQFAKAEGTPQVDHTSSTIAHALKTPKPPAFVHAVDKTQAVRNNSDSQ